MVNGYGRVLVGLALLLAPAAVLPTELSECTWKNPEHIPLCSCSIPPGK